ncbi:hypothetical protein F4803DRAFT_544251, partial [Xylaria telfairii]
MLSSIITHSQCFTFEHLCTRGSGLNYVSIHVELTKASSSTLNGKTPLSKCSNNKLQTGYLSSGPRNGAALSAIMLTPTCLNPNSFFYPIGNTPAISITQSFSPDDREYLTSWLWRCLQHFIHQLCELI